MTSYDRSHKKIHLVLVSLIFISSFLSACSSNQQTTTPTEPISFSETVENYPQAEVIFQVKLPTAIQSNEKLVLEILDDVTGEYFDPSHYDMEEKDAQNFFIRIPLIVGEKVKYRFLRQGTQTVYEYTTQNKQVAYRVLLVDGPMLVQDLVAGWADQPYIGSVGRIRGQLVDQKDNSPIPDMAVYAAGMRTISASDGTFILEGLPIGTQNVVIASLDGAYETFQQGATIAEEATTPIQITLKKRPLVEVYIEVKTPDGFDTNLPLRLASDLYSLGFPDTDLGAGSSMVSANLPVFTKKSQNLYSLNITLPSGTDLRYKFTFGDGFWNSELSSNGNFVTRDLLVPSSDTVIRKKIASLTSPNSAKIDFSLTTPSTTPANDQVSLQLNPFGWMQPLPMVKTGLNQWGYTLFTPLHLLSNIKYRFCRNDQCDIALSDPARDGSFSNSSTPQTISVNLENWQNISNSTSPTTVDTNGGTLQPRTNFIAGVELIKNYPPSWKSAIDQGLQSIGSSGANWVIISPTWTYTSTNPPLLEPVPGTDLLWPDLQTLMTKITANNMQPAVFPQLSDATDQVQFWNNAKRDGGWWQTTFDRYRRFILQNADLAKLMNASAIFIGDPGMKPAMNDGILQNGSTSNPPANANDQWSQLIRDIRTHYNGPVIGVISVPDQNSMLPGWLKDVDGIYVIFSPTLTTNSGDQSEAAIKNVFASALDLMIQPIANHYNKPIIIGLDYPSTQIGLNGCNAINDSCMKYKSSDLVNLPIDLDIQAKIYNAAIIDCANRPWINGFITRGFNPLVVVKDQGSSIYGKPASDVLWFWYHFILNKPS